MSKVSFQSRKWRNRIFNLSKVTSVNRNCQSKFQVLPIYISGLFSSTEFIGDHTLEYHIRSYQSAKLYQEQAVCCTEQTVCCTLMCFNLISLMGHPYIVRLFWIVIHTFLVEPLFFLESLSEIIFLEKGWSKNLKTFLSPFILYFTTNKKT